LDVRAAQCTLGCVRHVDDRLSKKAFLELACCTLHHTLFKAHYEWLLG
jgi:hypothetical protein